MRWEDSQAMFSLIVVSYRDETKALVNCEHYIHLGSQGLCHVSDRDDQLNYILPISCGERGEHSRIPVQLYQDHPVRVSKKIPK